MFFIDTIYYKLNKNKVEKAILKFKKISIDKVYEIVTRNCWEYGIQYEVIFKDKNQLEIKLIGRKEIYLIKFEKALAVDIIDYDKFINLVNIVEASKGYYITTGVFQQDVENKNNRLLLLKKIKLINGYNFIKRQIWLNDKSLNHISYNKLHFFKYLPN